MKVSYNKDTSKLFFISDTHFNHKNIISYCNRPFQDEFYMNEGLISDWNETVPEDGTVFHLGDFAMPCNYENFKSIIKRLNGEIHLILGNHCYQNKFNKPKFKELLGNKVYDVVDLKVIDNELDYGHVKFFMSHYPHLFWQRGSYHLHGHVHSGPKSSANEIVPYNDRRYDVGVDNNKYKPISYLDLKIMFTKRLMKI